MDPLAIGTYNPSTDSLPQIVSQNEMLMMPFLEDYVNQIDQLENFNGNFNPNSVWTPTATNPATEFNYDDYYAKMAANQARMSQYNMEQQERMRRESLISSAPIEKIQTAAMILQEKIAQNEQDQIRDAFNAFVQSIRAAYDPDGQADEGAIKARAISEYQRLTGRNLLADIRENGSTDFSNGLIRGATFGLLGNQNSTEDNIEYITGQAKSPNSEKLEKTGSTLGGAAAGAAAGAAIGTLCGGPLVGTVIGAVIGGAIGFFR